MEEGVQWVSLVKTIFLFWLEAVAALGTIVSVFTLLVMFYFRWQDRRTRFRIAYKIVDPADASFDPWMRESGLGDFTAPLMLFRVDNKGSTTVLVSDPRLILRGGQTLRTFDAHNPFYPSHMPPGFPLVLYRHMPSLAGELVAAGYSGTARIRFEIRDGSGKNHKKRVVIKRLEEWSSEEYRALFTQVPRSREILTYLCGCPLASSMSLRFSRLVRTWRLRALSSSGPTSPKKPPGSPSLCCMRRVLSEETAS